MTAVTGRPSIAVPDSAVQLALEATDPAQAIRVVGAPLVEAGLVTPAYLDAVVEREATWPTGLPTLPEAIAVPHGDPAGVGAPAIAVGRLAAPVDFVEMATSDRRVAVRLILLLALQSKDQAAVLGDLIRGLQDRALLEVLLTSDSRREVAGLVRGLVGGGTD